MTKAKIIVCLLYFSLSIISLHAQTDALNNDLLKGVSISGDWFIANRNSFDHNGNWENTFLLKRSYFTIKKNISPVYYIRYTQDLTIDKEGDDAGNVETRMKYLYLKIKPGFDNFITNPFLEIGMVHRPWITYEQNVNVYRVQGNMPMERNKLFNSAGFGFLFGGNIGPEMDKQYQRTVSNSMRGKYASFAVGAYNGGGYSAFENNSNKVVEGIINIRPLPEFVPQLQFTHSFNVGKGNTSVEPDFRQFLFHGGFVGESVIISGQYHFGKGDFKGALVDSSDVSRSLNNNGYSVFCEYKLHTWPLAAFIRYDYFSVDNASKQITERQITGLKYTFYQNLSCVLSGEKTVHESVNYIVIDLNLHISF